MIQKSVDTVRGAEEQAKEAVNSALKKADEKKEQAVSDGKTKREEAMKQAKQQAKNAMDQTVAECNAYEKAEEEKTNAAVLDLKDKAKQREDAAVDAIINALV